MNTVLNLFVNVCQWYQIGNACHIYECLSIASKRLKMATSMQLINMRDRLAK